MSKNLHAINLSGFAIWSLEIGTFASRPRTLPRSGLDVESQIAFLYGEVESMRWKWVAREARALPESDAKKIL